ncbi:MAG: MlaD family protein [Acidimicrobiales bacterium]|nr:MlaD family protein [Acidimicrobiales bacterium]
MTFRNLRRCGIIGVLLTLALTAFTFSVGGLHLFEKTYTVTAEFSSASGLETGDPVRVAGVNVGSVAAIDRRPEEGTVVAKLRLQQGVEVSQSVRASIRLRTLLGRKYLNLADAGAGDPLRQGAKIPLEHTEVATDVDTLLNSAEPVIESTDVDSINAVMRSTVDVLDDGRAEQLRSLFGDMEMLAASVADSEADLQRLLDGTARLSGALQAREGEVNTAIDGVDVVLGVLAARQIELRSLVAGVSDLSSTVTPLLDRNGATLDRFVSGLVETTQVLDAQRHRIDLALGSLPIVAERFYNTTREGSWVNVYIVGVVASPFLTNPVDLGSRTSGEPGETGGLPRLQLDPGQTPLMLLPDELVVPGVATVRTGDDRTIPPPEGYGR